MTLFMAVDHMIKTSRDTWLGQNENNNKICHTHFYLCEFAVHCIHIERHSVFIENNSIIWLHGRCKDTPTDLFLCDFAIKILVGHRNGLKVSEM